MIQNCDLYPSIYCVEIKFLTFSSIYIYQKMKYLQVSSVIRTMSFKILGSSIISSMKLYATLFLSIHFFLSDCYLEYCLCLHLGYLGRCVANSCSFVTWNSRDFNIWTSASASPSQLLQHQNSWFPIALIQSLIIRQFFLCDNGPKFGFNVLYKMPWIKFMCNLRKFLPCPFSFIPPLSIQPKQLY